MTSSWLETEPAPDVTRAERDDLINIWATNRNTMIGRVAADEMMKRLFTDRQVGRELNRKMKEGQP